MHHQTLTLLLLLLAVSVDAVVQLPSLNYSVSSSPVSHGGFGYCYGTPSQVLYEPVTDTMVAICPDDTIHTRTNVTTNIEPPERILAAADCNAISMSFVQPNSGHTNITQTTLMFTCWYQTGNLVKMVDLALPVTSQIAKVAVLPPDCNPGALYSHYVTCLGGNSTVAKVDSLEVVYQKVNCSGPGPISFGKNTELACWPFLLRDVNSTLFNITLPSGLTSRTAWISAQSWAGTIFAGEGGIVAYSFETGKNYTLATATQCNAAIYLLESPQFDLLFAICGDKKVYAMSTNVVYRSNGRGYLPSRTIQPKTTECVLPRSLMTNIDKNGIQVFIDCTAQKIFQYTLVVGPAGSADSSLVMIQRFGISGTPTCEFPKTDSIHIDSTGSYLSATCGAEQGFVRMDVSTWSPPPSIVGTPSYFQDYSCSVVTSIPSQLFPGQYLVICAKSTTGVNSADLPLLGRVNSTGQLTSLFGQNYCKQQDRRAILEDTMGGWIYVSCGPALLQYRVSDGTINLFNGVPGGAIDSFVMRGAGTSRELIITATNALSFLNIASNTLTSTPNQVNKAVMDSRGQVYVSGASNLTSIAPGTKDPINLQVDSFCPFRVTMTVDRTNDVLYMVCQTGNAAYSVIAIYQPNPASGDVASAQVIGWNMRKVIYGVAPVSGGVIIHTQFGLEYAQFYPASGFGGLSSTAGGGGGGSNNDQSSSTSSSSSSSSSSSGSTSGSTSSSSSSTSSSSSSSSTYSSSSSSASSSPSSTTTSSSTSDSSTASSSTSTSTSTSTSSSSSSSSTMSSGDSSSSSGDMSAITSNSGVSSSSSTGSGISVDSSSSSSGGTISSARRSVTASESSFILLVLLALFSIFQFLI